MMITLDLPQEYHGNPGLAEVRDLGDLDLEGKGLEGSGLGKMKDECRLEVGYCEPCLAQVW